MRWQKRLHEDQGAVLIGAIVVLVAVTLIGVTLMTVSTMEIDMATNEKCKEEARYNSESCAVSTIKLVRMVSDIASKTGELGIAEGDPLIQGVNYYGGDAEYFAKKVLDALPTPDTECRDVTLSPMGASANISPDGTTGTVGTAANRQISGYSYGVGLGGAGGGGVTKWVLVACRGSSCSNNGNHASYARYKRLLGVDKGM